MRCLVTGAARGLGEGVAARLVADGGTVALLDRYKSVHDTAARLQAASPGGRAIAVVGDVADPHWIDANVPGVVEQLGGLDLLVNNAGIGGPSTSVADTAIEELRRVLDVNLVGTFLMARACIPSLITAKGSIVNIGSIFGQSGVAGGGGYSASKGGVALLTHSLALELAPDGVRVNTIAPGNMMTEMHLDHLRSSALANGVSLDEETEHVRASVPLGRHGTPADIAGAVAWLASEDASYVTGQTIAVNGGALLS
jgi:NAD(P)-dependent dehydrogenase (short-subunit alcohol dehydrogenase family)